MTAPSGKPKYCAGCRTIKDETEFPSYNSKGRSRFRSHCRPCHRARVSAYHASDAGKATNRQNKLFRRYGITAECYADALSDQGMACAICRRPAGNETLCVDHNHATGALRGLLCSGCNTGLGLFNEDPAALRAAAEYVEKHK